MGFQYGGVEGGATVPFQESKGKENKKHCNEIEDQTPSMHSR
jgi:hypothetical protein